MQLSTDYGPGGKRLACRLPQGGRSVLLTVQDPAPAAADGFARTGSRPARRPRSCSRRSPPRASSSGRSLTIAYYADDWLATRRPRVRANTSAGYSAAIMHARSVFGHYRSPTSPAATSRSSCTHSPDAGRSWTLLCRSPPSLMTQQPRERRRSWRRWRRGCARGGVGRRVARRRGNILQGCARPRRHSRGASGAGCCDAGSDSHDPKINRSYAELAAHRELIATRSAASRASARTSRTTRRRRSRSACGRRLSAAPAPYRSAHTARR